MILKEVGGGREDPRHHARHGEGGGGGGGWLRRFVGTLLCFPTDRKNGRAGARVHAFVSTRRLQMCSLDFVVGFGAKLPADTQKLPCDDAQEMVMGHLGSPLFSGVWAVC